MTDSLRVPGTESTESIRGTADGAAGHRQRVPENNSTLPGTPPVAVDVIAVGVENGVVRIIARDKSPRNAEAVISMAVIRRGCDEEFFTDAPCGKYNDGDKYEGPDV